MFQNVANLFRIPDIRRRILVTLGFLLVYRVGWNIPIPGIDLDVLKSLGGGGGEGSDFAQLFGIISGGGIFSCALFSLGIMPYISASIIFSLLTKVVPSLEAVAKEGSAGQRKINQWTRLATVPLALVQAIILVANVYKSNNTPIHQPLLPDGFGLAILAVLALTAGTILLMWIGEQITEYGVGNGISLLIMAGIIARVPDAIVQMVHNTEGGLLPFVLFILFIAVVIAVVYITKGMRKIPVQYAKLTRGRKVYGGQRHFLPIKVNQAGVMPVIFSSALLSFPSLIGSAIGWTFMRNAFSQGTWTYTVLDIVLIFFFSFFWNSLMFNPAEMSKNMKEHGSFIPGIRPGKKTAEFLEKVMSRITLAGAAFLAVIASVPHQVAGLISKDIPTAVAYFLGGTSILIVVSVALDLVDKLNSALLMRDYGGFIEGGDGAGRRRAGKKER
ncbi:MAG: preprotein translocase subunit SecY [Planctomycetes bacterium]|nr:preprotein translocase subunit SecY [Planctomycetota bacterium]MCB9825849.1 preprotein translocase subunit SecY [Planctomycetota bacterium]MCB9829134.1 preprotein translocase subunit SecY [Planctomycetota bacterium]MCB9901248.1 preprotein translocase subunit SecY [Planctomycetota bacterium]